MIRHRPHPHPMLAVALAFLAGGCVLFFSLAALAKPRPTCLPTPNTVTVGEGVIAAADSESKWTTWLAWLAKQGLQPDCYVWAVYDSRHSVPQARRRSRAWIEQHGYADALVDTGPRAAWEGMRWGDTPHHRCFAMR